MSGSSYYIFRTANKQASFHPQMNLIKQWSFAGRKESKKTHPPTCYLKHCGTGSKENMIKIR
jgi:hypothetical protein